MMEFGFRAGRAHAECPDRPASPELRAMYEEIKREIEEERGAIHQERRPREV